MSAEIITAIKPELLIMVPVLYSIGEAVKRTNIKNWRIPFILWGVSIVLTTLYLLLSHNFGDSLVLGIVQGTFIAFSTVGTNQVYKQATEKRLSDISEKKEDSENGDGGNTKN